VDVTLHQQSTALDSQAWSLGTTGCEHEYDRLFFAVDTGYQWLVPGVDVTYSATDGITTYTCAPSQGTPGMVVCSGSYSQNFGPMTFCLQRPADAQPTCKVFSDFASWMAGYTCEPQWRFIGAGCHSANKIFFMIDTDYTWLTTDTQIAYTATDGQTVYSCDTIPDAQVYCSGARPQSPGPLTFCYQLPGDSAPTCKTFDNYPSQVTGFTCDATPTVGGPASACYAIKDTTTCWGTTGCTWNTKTGQCVPK
jgi:hypothetical protein